jgi:hypothetical protein
LGRHENRWKNLRERKNIERKSLRELRKMFDLKG